MFAMLFVLFVTAGFAQTETCQNQRVLNWLGQEILEAERKLCETGFDPEENLVWSAGICACVSPKYNVVWAHTHVPAAMDLSREDEEGKEYAKYTQSRMTERRPTGEFVSIYRILGDDDDSDLVHSYGLSETFFTYTFTDVADMMHQLEYMQTHASEFNMTIYPHRRIDKRVPISIAEQAKREAKRVADEAEREKRRLAHERYCAEHDRVHPEGFCMKHHKYHKSHDD